MVHPAWKVRAALAAGLVAVLGFTAPASAQFGGLEGDPITVGPSITSLSAVQVPGRKFRISGHVFGGTPGRVGVVITGAANGVAMCNGNGDFDAIYDVPTPGAITAVAGDGTNQSAPVNASLVNNAPTVEVIAVQGPGNTWTFSGSVGDECPAGLTVSLGGPAGVNGASATVGEDGSWSVTVTVAPGTSGLVTATVADWYDLTGSGQTYFSP
jgi:hypothetical protein